MENQLIQAFQSPAGTRVAVIGLGYVGLPLALEFARAGFEVTGIDIDARKVKSLTEGRSYVEDIKDSEVQEQLKAKRFTATTSFDGIKGASSVSICVPTPLRKTKDPDLSYIVSALNEVTPRIHPGMLVVLESTTYPGTTRELFAPRFEKAGLKIGKDIFVAFSPERVDPGNEKYNTRTTPKVIGGLTPACSKVAAALYQNAVNTVVPVGTSEEAEMVKLLENTFRAVNIALVNEMLLMCDRMKIDMWNVIRAAATKPFGFMPFYPGPGIGGHCIPLDPAYLSWKAKTFDFYNRFIELASDINGNMPRFVVHKASETLNKQKKALNGSKVLVFGVAYKPNISDVRESPAVEVIKLLEETGAEVSYYDPFVETLEHEGLPHHRSIRFDGVGADQFDLGVMVTHHKAFDPNQALRACKQMLDCRGFFKDPALAGHSKVVRL